MITLKIMVLSPWRTLTSFDSNLVTLFPNSFFVDCKYSVPQMLFYYLGVSLIHELKRHLSCVHSVFLEELCIVLSNLCFDTSVENTKLTLIEFAIR